jgi:hypothetical protein
LSQGCCNEQIAFITSAYSVSQVRRPFRPPRLPFSCGKCSWNGLDVSSSVVSPAPAVNRRVITWVGVRWACVAEDGTARFVDRLCHSLQYGELLSTCESWILTQTVSLDLCSDFIWFSIFRLRIRLSCRREHLNCSCDRSMAHLGMHWPFVQVGMAGSIWVLFLSRILVGLVKQVCGSTMYICQRVSVMLTSHYYLKNLRVPPFTFLLVLPAHSPDPWRVPLSLDRP